MSMQDEGQGLSSDILRRLRRVERKKSTGESVTQQETVQTGSFVFYKEPITLISGTATADVTRTSLSTGLPRSAKAAILWAGTTDRCDGSGLNYIYVYGGGGQFTVCEQRGTTTSDTQNNMNQSIVPCSRGALDYSIDLNGATNFPFRIDLVGYIE